MDTNPCPDGASMVLQGKDNGQETDEAPFQAVGNATKKK